VLNVFLFFREGFIPGGTGVEVFSTPIKIFAAGAILTIASAQPVWARDGMTITIPRRSQLTPVQRFNREGVEAVKKHDYEKAEALFLKAYLYDPADPFTLNNLGYISELQGQLDRANRFYKLASEQGCSAEIDETNLKHLKGKPMRLALENLQDLPMRVNRMNVDAVDLLSQGRGFDAVVLLKKTLSLDPQNPFTLNNLGVAEEAVGDYADAVRYYTAAANSHSSEPVVVTMDRAWRGRSVSRMAEASARQLEKRLQNTNSAEAQSVMLNLRGGFEVNQNNWTAARQDFLRAYSLNPSSAFSMNNRAYVAEREGDLETAQYFYQKAQRADNSNARVGLATQAAAEGKNLIDVSTDSDQKVDTQLAVYSQQRRRQQGPIELTPRGNAPAGNPASAPGNQAPQNPPSVVPRTTTPQTPHQ
jgi:Flp pilus assembly protein TadD